MRFAPCTRSCFLSIPFADLDANPNTPGPTPVADFNGDDVADAADYELWAGDFNAGLPVPTGLNATDDGARTGPEAGEVWGFNMSQISRDSANNFLPIWNWHDDPGNPFDSFALWPHGELTFQAAPAAATAAPEPSMLALLAGGLSVSLLRRRRR